MNKKGHMALGVLAGSAATLLPIPFPEGGQGFVFKALLIAVTGVAALLPDIDHKTSTVSSLLQFSAKRRKQMRSVGGIGLLIALVLWGLPWIGVIAPSEKLTSSAILVGLAGALSMALAHVRTLALSGAGIALLWAYHLYDLHWIALFIGGALLIIPAVQHRGIIHTPEFAAVLSLGLLTFAGTEAWWLQSIALGLVVGWWAHLAGDIFGTDGIHSLLLPKLGVALRWFANGGRAENHIALCCWMGSIAIWLFVFQQTFLTHIYL